MKINWNDIIERLAKTFVQAFLACLLTLGDIGDINISDWQTLRGAALSALIAAASAGICAVWNLILQMVREYQDQKNMTEFEKNQEAGIVDNEPAATPEEIVDAEYTADEGEPENEVEEADVIDPPDIWSTVKYFRKSEFKCPHCGAERAMSESLIQGLDAVREKYGKTVITCGYRCQTYNDSLKGSIKNSLHIKGRAADIYIKGATDTLEGRKQVIAYMRQVVRKFRYAYCNGYYLYADGRTGNKTASNMGKAIHIDVEA